MTDRPILFSAPMIRALLDDDKTQTRRIIKPQPVYPDLRRAWPAFNSDNTMSGWNWRLDGALLPFDRIKLKCLPGDRLWVREAFGYCPECGHPNLKAGINNPSNCASCDAHVSRFKPSIHMPRVVSRLTLTVTAVWVQRLQDISETDAQAEGIIPAYEGWATDKHGCHWGANARDSYRILWDDINGPGAWDKNPWVAAFSFTVHRGNIDNG